MKPSLRWSGGSLIKSHLVSEKVKVKASLKRSGESLMKSHPIVKKLKFLKMVAAFENNFKCRNFYIKKARPELALNSTSSDRAKKLKFLERWLHLKIISNAETLT